VLFILISSVVFYTTNRNNIERLIFTLLFGLAGTLSFAAFSTAVGFIPDDWSACRIAVPLSLLNGQHLYSDLVNAPSNCFFYLPVGAWMYLPAALIAKLTHSVSACLSGGWMETLLLYISPILILLQRSNRLFIERYFIFLLFIILTFSTASLRYAATMIHVDAVGIALAGSAVTLVLPSASLRTPNKSHVILSGGLLGLSMLTKQTLWAPITLLALAFLIFSAKLEKKLFIISFVVVLTAAFSIALSVENPSLMWLYAFQSATHVPQATSFLAALKIFLHVNFPISISLIAIFCFYHFCNNGDQKSLMLQLLIIAIGLVSSLFSIYSFTKFGADVNHFSFPIYLLLILIVLFFLEVDFFILKISSLSWFSFIAILISFPFLYSYLKTNCGSYLWINNPHQIAYNYITKYGSDKIYFPWQPIGSLLQKKSYHLDQGLKFESINHTGNRPACNMKEFLPTGNFKIAVRPFGASSYLAQSLNAKVSKETIPELPGWIIYNLSSEAFK
jgi:hypothetical protein